MKLNLDNAGKKAGKIPVKINYKIIELFSAGLYSSPHKAFEELVSNSYDAGATKVAVFIPSELDLPDSLIWVCDNGEGMNSDGLKKLWKIGESDKRLTEFSHSRKPIGKFGIGKLATYVLADKLIHLCKQNGEFRFVIMDYSKIPDDSEKPIELDEVILTEEEAKKILLPLIVVGDRKMVDFELFGESAEQNWTFAIMSNLKETQRIKEGTLKWILSSALPLSPQFNLFYNGVVLESSKLKVKKLKTWIFGKNDEVVEKENDYSSEEVDGTYLVNLPNIKGIHGYVELYEDSLLKGKSQEMGRSYGIFLMIRDRLINIDNPLIGSMSELNHAAFNRIRIIVHADGLDDYLTSGRETIKECPAFSDLQKYISQKFNRAKTFFDKHIQTLENSLNASDKISKTSARLSKRPLFIVAQKFLNGQIDEPLLIELPQGLSQPQKEEFLADLEDQILKEDSNLIKEIDFDSSMAPEDPLAKLDLKERKVKINAIHPFFLNYLNVFNSELPIKFMATAEILTEASMIEQEIDPVIIRTIIRRRDSILREVTYPDNPNAPAIALMIKNALSTPDELENAIFYGFKCLGFDTTKIGGKGKPDGKAIAFMGFSASKNCVQDYSITYECKSTGKEK